MKNIIIYGNNIETISIYNNGVYTIGKTNVERITPFGKAFVELEGGVFFGRLDEYNVFTPISEKPFSWGDRLVLTAESTKVYKYHLPKVTSNNWKKEVVKLLKSFGCYEIESEAEFGSCSWQYSSCRCNKVPEVVQFCKKGSSIYINKYYFLKEELTAEDYLAVKEFLLTD